MNITFVGSLDGLASPLLVRVRSVERVCVLATAAAFRGASLAIDEVNAMGIWAKVPVGVEAIDRASAHDAALVETVKSCSLIVMVEGAALHARSVWRSTPLAQVLAVSSLIAVGSVGSVLGATMIDPRGGAPTTGLGFFEDVVVGLRATSEQTTRTRDLLGESHTLVELGPHSIVHYAGDWRALMSEGLEITRNGLSVNF